MGQKQPTLNYIAALCGDLSKLATSAGHPLLSYLLEVARLEAQQRASPKPDAGNQAAEGDEVGLWVWDMRNDRCIADRYAAELYGLPTDAVAPGLPVESYFACIHQAIATSLGDVLMPPCKVEVFRWTIGFCVLMAPSKSAHARSGDFR